MDIVTYGLAKSYTDKKVKNIDVAGEVAEQLPDAVADYCDENFSEWSGALDSTLTDPLMAAPADKVGQIKSALTEVALNGYYTTEPYNQYIECADGQIISDGTITGNHKCAYKWLTAEEEALKDINFDDATYRMNLCYMLNGAVASYTTWLTTSPVRIDDSIQRDTVGVTFQRLDGVYLTETERSNTLYFIIPSENIGNLVTKDDLPKDKGLKCIYPDGFTSRIKPDIYYGTRFTADIDTDYYKVAGGNIAWISTTGNDSTGDGTENNPYLTLTKAMTVATTIHVKEGTYNQGTHYVNNVKISDKNIIGHGTVKFQNDNSDHYISTLNDVYIENIEFYHGTSNANNLMNASANTDGKTACFVNCTFVGGLNCLAVTAIDAVVVGCVAHESKFDGFNYHAYNGRIPNVLEMDCLAYNNGSALSGSNSCNGSTSHDGCKIIRLNGVYHDCYGGVVADIGLADGETTKSVNYGCIAYTSSGETSFNASFWASYNTEMYMYDCKSYGCTYDITALNDGVVVSRRLTTGRNVPSVYKADGATVLQY